MNELERSWRTETVSTRLEAMALSLCEVANFFLGRNLIP